MFTRESKKISDMSSGEIIEELLGLKLTDIETLDNGKVCLYFENDSGRNYVIDCTGEEATAIKGTTQQERFDGLQEKLELLAEKLNIDLDELVEKFYNPID